MTDLTLLPREALVKTSAVDHAEWNYRPLLGMVQRVRFKLVCSLLAGRRYERLLEAGYGSGVFMPQLKTYADEICGIDPHPYPREVAESLARYGVHADLHTAGLESLPFERAFFDCVVAISAMEYVVEIEQACNELIRVLRPGGVVVLVTPGQSPALDFALRLAGENANENYGDRRLRLMPTLLRFFEIDAHRAWPRMGGRLLRVYSALRLKVKPAR